MDLTIKEEGEFRYIESNPSGDVLLLLHGLFGALSNFSSIIEYFSKSFNVIVPILPILDSPIHKVSVSVLVDQFLEIP